MALIAMDSRLAETDRLAIPARMRAALTLLMQAGKYAAELRQDVWYFAVHLHVLRTANLSNSDLRWLAYRAYLQHALEMTADKDDTRIFRCVPPTVFTNRSCFVLTAAGAAAADIIAGGGRHATGDDILEPVERGAPASEDSAGQPKWDRERRQVRWGSCVVKEFKIPAPNQESILVAFEEEGWPARIDDPLRPAVDLDPRRRLRETIKALNRNQKCRLLRFMGNGRGTGVRWEFRQAISASETEPAVGRPTVINSGATNGRAHE